MQTCVKTFNNILTKGRGRNQANDTSASSQYRLLAFLVSVLSMHRRKKYLLRSVTPPQQPNQGYHTDTAEEQV